MARLRLARAVRTEIAAATRNYTYDAHCMLKTNTHLGVWYTHTVYSHIP